MIKVKKDLTGQTFGKLLVLEQADDIVRKSGKHITAWLCQCECGNKKIICGASLKGGRTRSCGCLHLDAGAKNLIDLAGQKFGRLTVIEKASNSDGLKTRKSRWVCKCDCGNITTVIGDNLRKGTTQSCGCYHKELLAEAGKNTLIDIVGERFGRLTVVSRAKTDSKQTMWNCLCDCGVEVCVSGGHLKDGHTQSCGCYHSEMISKRCLNNLIGCQFGELTVFERALDRQTSDTYWKCLCSCGNITEVRSSDLTNNRIMSCGCSKVSRGEMLVSEYLKNNKIVYEREYKFADCVDQRELPFDFYIPLSNTLIEVQGKQHYEPVDFAGRGEEWANETFLTVKKHDKIKYDYCQSHGIKLIYIPYWEFNNIANILNNLY